MEPRNRAFSTDADVASIVSIACWFDLLGYGSKIEQACFDPSHPEAAAPIARLRAFQRSVRRHSSGAFATLVINDGAAAQTHIDAARSDRAWRFIERCWALYRDASAEDLRLGGPGLRAVVAVGLRAKGAKDGIVAQNNALIAIIDALVSGEIDRDMAVAQAQRIRRVFDIVPQLQANFAFTRAYEAETSGRDGGFPGPNLFIDTQVFRGEVPEWVRHNYCTGWRPSKTSLSTNFIAVQGLEPPSDDIARGALLTGRELRAILRFPAGRRFCGSG